MGLFDTLRRWVDGDDGDDALSRAAAEQAKPRRQAEEFIAQIARAIGEVMHSEAVPLPPDQTVIPPEYVVFISDDDDRSWQGVKRRALETGLHHVLAEHARDLAGKTKLATTSFSVELRVDGTLTKGEVRVQHSWEESSSSNKTSITPRAKPAAPVKTEDYAPTPQNIPTPHTAPEFVDHQDDSSQLAKTVIGNDAAVNDDATRVTPRPNDALDNEATRVHQRELYKLEIWRDNQQQTLLPVYKNEISIGRKSNKIASDIQLENDPEISRPHIVIRHQAANQFWLVHKGKNPTFVGGQEIFGEQPIAINPGDNISIGSYTLRIQK